MRFYHDKINLTNYKAFGIFFFHSSKFIIVAKLHKHQLKLNFTFQPISINTRLYYSTINKENKKVALCIKKVKKIKRYITQRFYKLKITLLIKIKYIEIKFEQITGYSIQAIREALITSSLILIIIKIFFEICFFQINIFYNFLLLFIFFLISLKYAFYEFIREKYAVISTITLGWYYTRFNPYDPLIDIYSTWYNKLTLFIFRLCILLRLLIFVYPKIFFIIKFIFFQFLLFNKFLFFTYLINLILINSRIFFYLIVFNNFEYNILFEKVYNIDFKQNNICINWDNAIILTYFIIGYSHNYALYYYMYKKEFKNDIFELEGCYTTNLNCVETFLDEYNLNKNKNLENKIQIKPNFKNKPILKHVRYYSSSAIAKTTIKTVRFTESMYNSNNYFTKGQISHVGRFLETQHNDHIITQSFLSYTSPKFKKKLGLHQLEITQKTDFCRTGSIQLKKTTIPIKKDNLTTVLEEVQPHNYSKILLDNEKISIMEKKSNELQYFFEYILHTKKCDVNLPTAVLRCLYAPILHSDADYELRLQLFKEAYIYLKINNCGFSSSELNILKYAIQYFEQNPTLLASQNTDFDKVGLNSKYLENHLHWLKRNNTSKTNLESKMDKSELSIDTSINDDTNEDINNNLSPPDT